MPRPVKIHILACIRASVHPNEPIHPLVAWPLGYTAPLTSSDCYLSLQSPNPECTSSSSQQTLQKRLFHFSSIWRGVQIVLYHLNWCTNGPGASKRALWTPYNASLHLLHCRGIYEPLLTSPLLKPQMTSPNDIQIFQASNSQIVYTESRLSLLEAAEGADSLQTGQLPSSAIGYNWCKLFMGDFLSK